jgi:hypothetical protein
MPVTDADLITRILFAETGDLRLDPADSQPGPALADLRQAIADQIAVSNNGVGFAPPAQPTSFDLLKQDVVEAWQQCRIAAQTAVSAPARGVGPTAIFVQRAGVDPTTDQALLSQFPWLANLTATAPRGRALQGNMPVASYSYSGASVPTPGRYPPPAQAAEKAVTGFKSRTVGGLSFLFCVALIVVGGWWAEQASEKAAKAVSSEVLALRTAIERLNRAHTAAEETKSAYDTAKATADRARAESDAADHDAKAAANANRPLTDQQKTERDKVEKKRQDAETAEMTARDAWDKRGEAQRSAETEKATRTSSLAAKHKEMPVSLLAQALLILGGLVLLLCIVSWGLRREMLGFFVDDRGRMSLARLQFVLWTVVILSGYFLAAMWNLGVTDPAAPVLPTMQQDLWLLLGLVTASPLVSALILDSKGRTDPVSPQAGSANQPGANTPQSAATAQAPAGEQTSRGVLNVRSTRYTWSFLDLFSGEEIGNSGTVDISRVQQFIFTLVLIMAYGSLVLTGIVYGALAGARIAKMPELDLTLVGLLALSHSAYLAAKALPKKT